MSENCPECGEYSLTTNKMRKTGGFVTRETCDSCNHTAIIHTYPVGSEERNIQKPDSYWLD